jgi:hypothetical protein
MFFTFPKKFKRALEQNNAHWEGLAQIINAQNHPEPSPLTGTYQGYSIIAKIVPFGGRVLNYRLHLLVNGENGQDWRIRFSNLVPGQAQWGIFALDSDFAKKVRSSGILPQLSRILDRGEEISYSAKDLEVLYQFQVSNFSIMPSPAKFEQVLAIMAQLATLQSKGN